MAECNNATMVASGPALITTAPDDRLSRLPQEILDAIYALVFHPENGPWTLHINVQRRPSQHAGDPKQDRILSILALPRGAEYRHQRQSHPNVNWPDNVEEAFFRGGHNLNTNSNRT